MTVHFIRISGCDDSTRIRIDLSASEHLAVSKVFEGINKVRDYGCQPSAEFATDLEAWEIEEFKEVPA